MDSLFGQVAQLRTSSVLRKRAESACPLSGPPTFRTDEKGPVARNELGASAESNGAPDWWRPDWGLGRNAAPQGSTFRARLGFLGSLSLCSGTDTILSRDSRDPAYVTPTSRCLSPMFILNFELSLNLSQFARRTFHGSSLCFVRDQT